MRHRASRLHSSSILYSSLAMALAMISGLLAVPQADATNPEKAKVIRYNNDGVRLLKVNNFTGATDKFMEALKIDPSYKLARDNLAIAYNNQGIHSKDQHEALRYFHMAMLIGQDEETTRTTEQNLRTLRATLYKDTKTFDGLVKVARDCFKHDDQAGAYWEYKEALALKKDEAVSAELSKVQLPSVLEKILKAQTESADFSPKKVTAKETADVDFGPYMSALQRRIKRHWFPPKRQKTKHVVAVFKVHRDGQLSDVKITTSAGKESDDAALEALKKAAPFDKLPANSPENVDIQFSFDYNVFKDGQKIATKDGANDDKAEDSTGDKTEETAESQSSTGSGSLNYRDSGQKAQSEGSSSSASPDSSKSSSKGELANLSDILKWVIPGTIGFFVIGAVIALLMSKQRD